MDARKPLRAGESIGGYEVIRVIGRGGFGIVYEGCNPVTLEHVAIKQFYPSGIATWQEGTIAVRNEDDEALVAAVLKRFKEEAKLQYAFNHPNILKVKNYISGDYTGYVISDLIDGETLVEMLRKQGGFFPDSHLFQRIMEQVIGAVGYVHRMGRLHRDISPDNIMVDWSGRAILVDFGAAKFDLRSSNRFSTLVQFKQDYAPPEQHDSTHQPQGFYTDVFALAGTMYYALAGRPPERVITRLLTANNTYVPIAEASRIACPPQIFTAIDCGLRLSVRERPQTVEAYAEMLGWQPDFGEAAPLGAALLESVPGDSAPVGHGSARNEAAAVVVHFAERAEEPVPPNEPAKPERTEDLASAIGVVACSVAEPIVVAGCSASEPPVFPAVGSAAEPASVGDAVDNPHYRANGSYFAVALVIGAVILGLVMIHNLADRSENTAAPARLPQRTAAPISARTTSRGTEPAVNWQLSGVTNFTKGDFRSAGDDFARSNAENPWGYTMLWQFLARGRSGRQDGRAELVNYVEQLKSKFGHLGWPYPLIEFYLGSRSLKSARDAAKAPGERCEAVFFIGAWHVLKGNMALAKSLLRQAVNICPDYYMEYRVAKAELARLR